MKDAEAKALFQVIEPLLPHDRVVLREEVTALKQRGGEAWAAGEMLERACILLDAWGQHGGLPALESEPEPLAEVEGWMSERAIPAVQQPSRYGLASFTVTVQRSHEYAVPVTVIITQRGQ